MTSEGPFTDLAAFQHLPRTVGLVASRDGRRLVAVVSALDPDGNRFASSLWEVDPTGARPAHRLTHSKKGESSPVFTDSGDLLFCSARPDPQTTEDDPTTALWLLPAAGGEARVVATRAGGVGGPVAQGGRVLLTSDTLPSSTDDDTARRKARADAKVTAVLHTGYPVRYWDADLGPGQTRLLVGPPDALVDLTPSPGRSLDSASYDLSGDTVVTTWQVAEPRGERHQSLVAIDVETGVRRVLLDDDGFEHAEPRVSPDGTQVVVIRESRTTPTQPPRMELVVVPLAGGPERVVAAGWDRWPTSARWSADGMALYVLADSLGRAPVFRIDLATDEVVQLTTDDGAYTDVCIGPDALFALRSSIDSPPTPVRIDPTVPGAPTFLPLSDVLPVPGTLTELMTTRPDGSALRSWLVLPEGDGPHPLVLWVHGGPLGSWNDWSFRWCPWLMAARGWAVLLPDPSLSTGYGQDHVDRGWGDWGGSTYDDVLTSLDAALERDDLDATRTAMMGGSFGGYMANWIAGHTDRFGAIVTHASLWNLEQFGGTTDAAGYWSREMTPQMSVDQDPSRSADAITTPLLVIHGDKDYRVPIGEGLRLWWDLCSRADDPVTMPHRFLYFPDENHWVLTPNHAKLWYDVVLAFLAQHVLGEPEVVPDLLR